VCDLTQNFATGVKKEAKHTKVKICKYREWRLEILGVVAGDIENGSWGYRERQLDVSGLVLEIGSYGWISRVAAGYLEWRLGIGSDGWISGLAAGNQELRWISEVAAGY
jgi:hypothetical protein